MPIRSVKRFIGRTFNDSQVCFDRQHVTYRIEEAQRQKVVIRSGDRLLTPPQISAAVLHKLKEDAEVALGGKKVTQAVITVPAYFNESQRQATKEAGEIAGLYVPRIINEPTAAALAFGLGAEPQTVMVYDLGGGTFDVSILRIEHGLFRVRATNGDTHLGGDDFDLAIACWMKEVFEREHQLELPTASDANLNALLRQEAERAKIALTNAAEYLIDLPNLTVEGKSFGFKATLTQSKLAELTQPLIARSLEIADEALQKAGLRAADLDQILLVGGQTRMPAVKKAVRDHFHCQLNDSIDPDLAVAQGAAILGARLCGHLKDRVKLWDVIPLSLGIELADGRMDCIVPANQQIPCKSKSRLFTNQRDGQESIRFRIFQGERPIARDNVFIGEVTLQLTISRPANEHRIECLFSVDQDGILPVFARDAHTDAPPVEEKFDHVYRLTQREVDALVEEAKAHQEEDVITSRLLQLQEEFQRLEGLGRKEDIFIEKLGDLAAAIENRLMIEAEKLIAELKRLR